MRNCFFLTFFFVITFARLHDCSAMVKNGRSLFTQDMRHFVNTGKNIARAPLHFRNNDWLKTGLITSGTVLLFFVDKNIQRFARSHQNPRNDRFFNFDQFYGNEYTAALTVGVYGFGTFFNKLSIRKAGLQSMEAFVYSGLITSAVKVLLGRRRPYGGKSHLFFKPFQPDEVFKSLPSGHTTVSFAVSTVLAKSWDNPIWKTFWYGTAGMVAASRVYHNAHWASDVFLGGIIGYSVARYIINFDNSFLVNKKQRSSRKFTPYFSTRKLGILVWF